MDNVNTLIEKVNNKTKDSPIFFITNDAERALGLEKVLNNYHIICIDDNEIVDFMQKQGVNVFSLEKKLGEKNSTFRNSNRLLNHELVQEYIKKNSNNGGFLMFFKIAPNLERSTEKLGLRALNTSSALNRKFELKLSQYETLKDLAIKLPKTIIQKLSETDFETLRKELNHGFVVQFNRGHTGGGTLIIESKAQLEQLKSKFPKREVRISEFIKGTAYTLNACITRGGVCWGGLSYQITGVEELTAKKAGTVGNDWIFPKNLSKEVKSKIEQYTKEIGNRMAKDKFIGMYGLDIVIQEATDEPFIIEINARQPASIPFFTKLQLYNDQIPLSLLAIAEFLGIDYQIDIEKYDQAASSVFEASQVFLRNKSDKPVEVIDAVKPGLYRLVGEHIDLNSSSKNLKEILSVGKEGDKKLVHSQDAYCISKDKTSQLLLLCAKEGKIISPNFEVARLQTNQSLIDDAGQLKAWIKEVMSTLNRNIILKQIIK